MKAKFSADCSIENLKSIRNFIRENIEEISLPNLEKQQIVLAVDEVCANAIIHGNKCDESKAIEVEIEISKNKLQIHVYNIGNMDKSRLKAPFKEMNEIIKNKQKGGMGLKIIHTIMDTVKYYRKNNVHICSLSKKL